MAIVFWAAGWLVGLWAASLLELPTLLLVVLGGAAFAAAVMVRAHTSPFALTLFLSAAALGAARYGQSRPQIDAGHIASWNGREAAELTGVVVRAPELRETYQNLVVAAETVAGPGEEPQPVRGRVLVQAPRAPLIAYGSRLRLTGSVEAPHAAPGTEYRAYLARQAIFSAMTRPDMAITAEQQGNVLVHGLLAIREKAQRSIEQLLPRPEAALLCGILLGDSHGLSQDLEQDFRASGTTHIIAISGFNMALIAGALLIGGSHLIGRRPAAWVALGAIAAYAFLVGAEPSVVRAAIMSGLFVTAAALLGRPTFAPAALLAAAFLMTLHDPDILWDAGFQLSFAATLGLMLYVGPWSNALQQRMQRRFRPDTSNAVTRVAVEFFLSTMAALVMTLPLLAYHFETFSLVSPLANLLILPAQPGIMAWGGAATLAGMVAPALGRVPAWIAWLFLSYTIGLARYFGSLPVAMTPMSLSGVGLAGSYVLILFATWTLRGDASESGEGGARISLNGRGARIVLMGVIMAALLATCWAQQRPDGRLHVAFLDVGQGDAVFVQSPNGRQMLVDGGKYPDVLLSRLGEQLPFWDKELDLLVVTHPDDDHVAGLAELLGHYRVGQILTNGAEGQSGTPYGALIEAAREEKTALSPARAGQVIDLGSGVQAEILHAGAQGKNLDDNNASIVMRLTYGDFSLLLTGDAEQPVEEALLGSGRELRAAVLKAGHHGSQKGSSAPFLDRVDPQMVIISCGAGNRYGHPHEQTLQRIAASGAAIWRTDEWGTIEMISDGRTITTHTSTKQSPFP